MQGESLDRLTPGLAMTSHKLAFRPEMWLLKNCLRFSILGKYVSTALNQYSL